MSSAIQLMLRMILERSDLDRNLLVGGFFLLHFFYCFFAENSNELPEPGLLKTGLLFPMSILNLALRDIDG
jgi:hypothetical protein